MRQIREMDLITHITTWVWTSGLANVQVPRCFVGYDGAVLLRRHVRQAPAQFLWAVLKEGEVAVAEAGEVLPELDTADPDVQVLLEPPRPTLGKSHPMHRA